MSSEKFKIIMEDAKKNVEKYKIFKETDINYITFTLNNYVYKNKLVFFGNYGLSIVYPKNKIILADCIPEKFNNYIANPGIEYQIFSSDIVKDLFNLTNILSTRFKNIKAYPSFILYEYIIEINFKAVIKINYCPKDIMDLLSKKKTSLDPQYLLFNILDKLIKPIRNSSYWYYYYKQWELIIKNYKVANETDITFDNKNNNLKKEILNTFLSYNKECIVVGDIAYKLINNLSLEKDLGVIELLSCCILKDLHFIFKNLISKYKIKYKKINNFFIYFSHYYEIYVDNELIIKIYDNNNHCNYLIINSFNVYNVNGQILFLLNKILECKYKKEDYKHYQNMIDNYIYFYKNKSKNCEILQTNIFKPSECNSNKTIGNISYNPTNMTDFQKSLLFKKLSKIKFPELSPQVIIEKEIIM